MIDWINKGGVVGRNKSPLCIHNIFRYSSPLSVAWTLVTHFQRTGYGGSVQWWNFVNITTTDWSRLPSPGRNQLITLFPGMLWLSRGVHFRGVLSQNTQPQADFEENIRQTQIGSTLPSAWPTLFTTTMITNNKERLRNFPRPEETYWLSTVWCPKLVLEQKRLLMWKVKSKWVYSLLNSHVPIT